MKIKQVENRKRNAFTLIEMIGVLAVIAILAALLIPKIFEAINNARINNAVVSYNTVKTAVMDHYAKFGSLASSNGVAFASLPEQAYDRVLLAETFLDKPFIVKIGDGINSATNTHVEAVAGQLAATAVSTSNSAYDLDGSGATVNDVPSTTSVVLQAVITGVTEIDAHDVSERLDGTDLSVPVGTAGGDLKGRVKYAAATPTTVYIYVTHR